jgi:hypothetical protein
MIQLTSESSQIEIAPEVGAKIVSFVDLQSGYHFLWRNSKLPLRREQPGADYDPNFYGGIDELLPNDIPESIAGNSFPDHGEVWTAPFDYRQIDAGKVFLKATLPVSGFEVSRTVALQGRDCVVESEILNRSATPLPFLWKLHVALSVHPGDRIECPATQYTVADPDWSRRSGSGNWVGETIPEPDNTTEFLYLHDIEEGLMSWNRGNKRFEVRFDPQVFRYAWYFASYGGFDDHFVAILEPCTSMPISVADAHVLGQCTILGPGASLCTTYTYSGIVDED